MSNNPNTPRFALFPQAESADEQGRRPVIRRYSLARISSAPVRGKDGKRSRD